MMTRLLIDSKVNILSKDGQALKSGHHLKRPATTNQFIDTIYIAVDDITF